MRNLENTENDIPEEIRLAMEMPDKEYIQHLENYIQEQAAAIQYGKDGMTTFVNLLSFIGENFGETADFPVRIDSDFYKDVFKKELDECVEKLNLFLQKYEEIAFEEDEEDIL